MDSFVSKKRRKTSPSPDPGCAPGEEEEDTDFKLAILSSMHPELDQSLLLEVLLSNDGSVEKAKESPLLKEPSSTKKPVVGYQSSLKDYVTPTSEESNKRPKLMTKRGKTLHLYSPEDIAAQTPCTIVHNFLPPEEADELLSELLPQASTFERITFKLFENVVSSPHTACFYVAGLEDQAKQKTEYIYNGAPMTDVRLMEGRLLRIKDKVQQTVNEHIDAYNDGKRLKFQSSKPWEPNCACVNQYDGAKESVGYHSDQMTYLGPKTVIGSLSLGVAREFRIRRVVPREESATGSNESSDAADLAGQISIHLPHNSLLVMHAGMQEEWKHSIAPAQAIDPHPVSGNRRINITYRHYRPSLHPKFTPRCKCGVPTVLRVVQKRRENFGKYFWHCYAGSVPGKTGCDFFEWASFTDEGEPIWKS